jgi:hypothetical protein
MCLPELPHEYRICIWQVGDQECPADRYPEKLTLYKGIGEDLRTCTACDCEPPAGSACTGCIATYSDKTCSVMRGCYDVASGGLPSVCVDLPQPGVALFSKQALNVTYTPGTCQPTGGVETGDIERLGQSTLCCLPFATPPH